MDGETPQNRIGIASGGAVARPARGRVARVNVSPGGVPKLPVPAAFVGPLGLDGDGHDDRTEHGGPFRAVCLYTMEAIGRVHAEGHPIEPGSVGENLTLEGIELSTLRVADRLEVGDALVLEITKPANPCETIRGSFLDGRTARISIRTHPLDSRLYARVLVPGTVRPGDPVERLPPLPDSDAPTHALLDRLEKNERADMLSIWRAAREGGVDVRILDDGELVAAAAPGIPDANFNAALGARTLPHLVPDLLAFFRMHSRVGWIDAAEPPWPGATAESTGSVLAADAPSLADAVTGAAAESDPDRGAGLIPGDRLPAGLRVREIGAGQALAWERTAVAGFGYEGVLADGWLASAPGIATDSRMHLVLADVDGEPVGVGGLFVHGGVGGLGPGCVLPAWRGRGIHRELIAARLRLALELGCDVVAGWARRDSQSERNLSRLGLRRVWTRHTYRWTPDVDRQVAAAAETAAESGALP